MAEKRLDVLIFGATGFTGKYAVKEAARLSKINPFSWGVAGRNEERLNNIIEEFVPEFGSIPVIIADIEDDESLINMARICKIVVNCCGPYRFYGEAVVKACINSGTHHLDVSGEVQYMEEMQLQYNKAAQDAGVYVISACGFDSIPCDLGIIFTQQKFKGEINSVETYLNFWTKHNKRSAVIHYGTWESAVHGLNHDDELRDLRTKLFPNKLPNFEPKLHPRGLVHRNAISAGWSVPFLGSDRDVAYRSQYFLYKHDKVRPAQLQTYVTLKSILSLISLTCIGAVFSLMTKFKYGRSLLLMYPRFFSCGLVSHEGPDPEAMENTHFSLTLSANGWKDKLAEPTDNHTNSMDKQMIAKVSGTNPAYGATCTMLMISALTVLREAHKMPNNGGVLSPGAAFAKTTLIDQLDKSNIKFEVISSIEK
ncbi:hypothetical protein PV327_010975 [Microctonus hyperodae]|uniref:Saccharopine dehydrogenase NADP binding domain-containing protein n=1 Tax=Microctonus hyperodae TaxID=165561 RepID=A0AA39FS07_MICHY|nr:hypothetical protein PV327_010975 [Microctonus hyperodae]